MRPLGTLFSAIDTTKRKLGDLFSSPVQSAQQMIGYANDRARGLNALTSGAAQEMKQGLLSGGNTYGPQSQQLAQTLADAYNPMGMTSIGPRSAALETARKNAVKMLGLPENNTAMDRAKALGFDKEVFHGTGDQWDADLLKSVDPDFRTLILTSDGIPSRSALFTSESPKVASGYALAKQNSFVSPLLVKEGKQAWTDAKGQNWKDVFGKFGVIEANARGARNTGWDTYKIKNVIDQGHAGFEELSNTIGVLNPSSVRSRFAAFDPARVNENDLLGRADPRLLGLLGIGAGGGVGAYNYFNDK